MVAAAAGVPLDALLATGRDSFRKPAIGMWQVCVCVCLCICLVSSLLCVFVFWCLCHLKEGFLRSLSKSLFLTFFPYFSLFRSLLLSLSHTFAFNGGIIVLHVYLPKNELALTSTSWRDRCFPCFTYPKNELALKKVLPGAGARRCALRVRRERG